MKSKNPVGGHPPSDGDLNFDYEYVSVLKDHLERGIELLRSITSKTHKQHPLLVAQKERIYRLGNWQNQARPFMTCSVEQFHHAKINRIDRLAKLKERIDNWAGDCAESIRSIYLDADYHDRFMKLKVDHGLLADIPDKSKKNEEFLAGIQIKLKTQLENMLYFLIRRVAYFEEFGQYPKIMALELLIENYTRKFLKVLIDERLFGWTIIYPDYYDPQFIIMNDRKWEELAENQEADVGFIITTAKSLIIKPSRGLFRLNMSTLIIDGTEVSKDICDEITNVKDEFERELIKSIGKKFPRKFKTQWDNEIVGVEQTFDLQTMINRLPVYLRDSISISKNTKKKAGSNGKGKRTTRERNIDIQREYSKLQKEGISHTAALKKLAETYDRSVYTIKDILYTPQE